MKLKYNATEMLDLYLGPQVGFNVLSEARSDVVTADFDSANSIDFGLVGGAEYVTTSGFGGGVGYNLGFTNVIDEENASGENLDGKNSVFNINLIYKFSR